MSNSFFSKIVDFFTDNERSIGSKFSYAILTIFLLLVIDVVFKPTYSLHESNKLTKLEKIASLKVKYKDDYETIKHLNQMQQDIIDSKHYFDYSKSLWSSLFEDSKKGSSIDTVKNNNQTNKDSKLSIFYTALSSSGFFALLFVFMLINPIVKRNLSAENIGGAILGASLSVLIGGIITGILMLVPVMWYPFVNYLLYFAFQIFMLFGLSKLN